MKRHKINVISGFVLSIVSIMYLLLSTSIIERSGVSSGRLVPQIAGGALLGLSVLLIGQGVFGLAREKKRVVLQTANTSSEQDFDRVNYRKVILTLISFAIYIACLKPIGFIISTFVYLCVQMYLLATKEQRKKRGIVIIIVTSIITTATLFLLFRYSFQVMLPMGILD